MARRLITGKSKAALLFVVCAACGVAAGSGWASAGLRAFQRPARANDLPPAVTGLHDLTRTFGAVIASRRVASLRWQGRSEALYLLILRGRAGRGRPDKTFCTFIALGADRSGAGCASIPAAFLPPHRYLSVGTAVGQLYGVTANDVTDLTFVYVSGRQSPVKLDKDGGFIFACPVRSACSQVKLIRAYDQNHRLLATTPVPRFSVSRPG
jgi:hypothetical protein